MDDRLCELGHLFHAVRVGPQLPIARFAEPDVEQHLVRLLERRLGWKPRQLRHLPEKSDRRHLADERIVLRHVADSRARFAHVAAAVHAQDARASRAWTEKPEQRQDQRGLARPVRAEQSYRFSRARNAETAGDPVEDLPPSEFHFEVVELDNRYVVQVLSVNVAVPRRIAVALSPGPVPGASWRP